jgi:uncharacterized protein YndB with AHSA1/START domain
VIVWRVHLAANPEAVYALLATDEGRARFWAESAIERAGEIEFTFPNGWRTTGRVLTAEPPRAFAVEYLGAPARFTLTSDGRQGTDLTVEHFDDHPDTRAGWVSVLLALKATVNFGVDLRNHDSRRTWDEGYVDN